MCRRVQCSTCGRSTFAGCGMHVEQVLGGVPKTDRCVCNEANAKVPNAASAAKDSGSWLKNFLSK